ncbi:MAG: 3' terminal RNA ribose 2'-O-methyltransferase Hen1 [Peptococcaceae bacterium]|jgi:SAM-dependent methyltransferase|nr:3' terminal RNA ribose 2'-O-methyltransferase Hen1 [Peptococcaceae bacterium]
MLLTITYTGRNTTDLGYLLYKNPYRPQAFELSYGKAYVFYPEISDERTTAALLLDIDPVGLARGRAGSSGGGLFDYVNDRPYVSSSFMSTAISRVFGTAMTGRADSRQALSDSALDLTAAVTMLPCRGEREKLDRVFEPLGYEVRYETFVSDGNFPGWGDSPYVNLTVSGKVRLRDLLKHLYVLIPVFDRQKHYWVGGDEVEKLLRMGENWLPGHPEKAYITGRYLKRRRTLVNMAFERLTAANAADGEVLAGEGLTDDVLTDGAPEGEALAGEMLSDGAPSADVLAGEMPSGGAPVAESPVTEAPDAADRAGRKPNLNARRLDGVVAALKSCGAKRVIDIGCGEGHLLSLLVKERQFTEIVGADVSHAALERASGKLKLEHAGDSMRERVRLIQGSLTYKDARFAGYDAACVVEVVEHLDLPRLAAFERVLFEFAKPPVVILTTPNREYNARYERLYDGDLRHSDHRFEWTRAEFRDWAARTADRFGYAARFSEIGETDETYGAPTQMGVFTQCE